LSSTSMIVGNGVGEPDDISPLNFEVDSWLLYLFK